MALKIIETDKTVREYYDMWLKEYKFVNLKATSYDVLERTVENYIYPIIADKKMSDVTSGDARRILSLLVKKEYSVSTIKKAYDALNSCFDFAVANFDLERNPMWGIKAPCNQVKQPEEIYIYTNTEARSMINQINRKYSNGNYVYHNGLAFILILNTGLRSGEALGLKWCDYNAEKKTLKVTADVEHVEVRDENLNKIGKQIAVLQNSPKSRSSVRLLHLNDTANAIIQYYYEKQKKMGIESEFIICSKKGDFLTPSGFRKAFKNIANNADITEAGIHSLRHTFATELYRKGVDIKIISKILGHSSVKITYDTYIHVWEDDLESVTDKLEDVFGLEIEGMGVDDIFLTE